jgi:acetyl esterase/lipase
VTARHGFLTPSEDFSVESSARQPIAKKEHTVKTPGQCSSRVFSGSTTNLAIALFLLTTCALLPFGHTTSEAQQQKQRRNSPFSEWDKNGDGFLVLDEFPNRLGKRLFARIDANNDGRISKKEDDAFRARNQNRQNAQPSLPAGSKVDRNIIYETIGKRKLPLDLYRPATSQPVPLVIWVHGGGWKSGTKNGAGPALALLERGYAVASVEYRLSGEAIFPAAIEDCKAAVSFLRLNANKYQLDPHRFGVWGSSAGGHLVALLGTTNDVNDFDTHPVTKKSSSAVQAICNWFGPTDFLRMDDFPGKIHHDGPDSPESRFIGGPIQDRAKQVQKANPISYVTANDPPFLILHGENDQLVPFQQSQLLHDALQKAGVQSELYRVKNGDHGFKGATESREKLVERSMNFFDSLLKAD